MNVSNINPCFFQRMNTWRTKCLRKGGAATRGNQNPPQAPAERVAIPVNPAGLTDGEVRASPAQMSQSIMMQDRPITVQVNRQDVPKENQPFAAWLTDCEISRG